MITVSVLMPTFNHEIFIAEAIDSFLNQYVDFDVELLIGDDCSSDATPRIVQMYAQRYPDQIRYFHYQQNQGLMKNYQYLLNQAKGKYIAILESDDVWVDVFKLKKQVEVMEKTENCGLVFSNWYVINEKSIEIARSRTPRHDVDYRNLLKGNFVAAVTVLFSKKMFDMYCNIEDYIAREFKTLDYPVWLSISAHARIIYLDDYTANYRRLVTSISNNNDYKKALCFEKSVNDIVDYIVERYGRGGMSQKELENTKIIRYIILALQFNRPWVAISLLVRDVHVVNWRSFIMKFFPLLWVLKNRHFLGMRK